MNEIARKKWGFDGYITSDCAAVDGIKYNHGYTNSTDQTILATLSAGMDIDCGGQSIFMGPEAIQAAVANQSSSGVTESIIDTAITHTLSVQFRLGMLDPPEMVPYSNISHDQVNTRGHQQLAKEAADQSLVLLRNPSSVLPLSIQQFEFGTIALVGPHANATTAMQGNYYGPAPYLISPLAGLRNRTHGAAVRIAYAPGCVNVSYCSTQSIAAAAEAAGAADATVMVLGLDGSIEGENIDRTSVLLPAKQTALALAVITATQNAGKKRPLILVIMSGGVN